MDAQALGRYLRQSREAKELTLEDAEHALRIRRRILESFELGDFAIPDSSSIQITGFLRNYARWLGLEEDTILQYYEGSLYESQQRERRAAKKKSRSAKRNEKRDTQPIPINGNGIRSNAADTNPKPPKPAPPANGYGSYTIAPPRQGLGVVGFLVRLLIGAASLAVIVFVAVQLLQNPNVNPFPTVEDDPTSPDILAQLPPTFTFTPAPTRTPVLSTPVPEGLQQLFSGQGVLVTIQFRQRSWVRVVADDVERFVGIARPGTILEYPAQDQIVLTASNAEALEIAYNGALQPTFGDRGQRVDLTFTRSGVNIVTGPGFEPTAEFSDTPMPTPTDPAGNIVAALTPTVTNTVAQPLDTAEAVVTDSVDAPAVTEIVPTISVVTPSELPPTASPTVPSPTPSITPIPLVATATPTVTLTPTITVAPTETPIPSPTAILPPRATATGQPPPKGR